MWSDRRHLSDRTLTRFLDAELSRRRQASAARHLTGCARCASRLRILTDASDAIKGIALHDDTTSRDVDRLRGRLRNDLAETGTALAESVPAITKTRLATPLTALAAGLVAIAWMTGPLHRSSPAPWGTLAIRIQDDALPDSSLTPGAVRTTSVQDVCPVGRAVQRQVEPSIRDAVLRAYGMAHVPAGDYELDYLITPELGGAAERANLWPERYGSRVWNARVKDELERLLPQLVCDGRVDLAAAQRDIATDWIAAYRKYFHATMPLTPTAGASDEDDLFDRAGPRLVALAQLARR